MAIAFDAAADGGLVNPGTSLTWSHTCTGSNLILYVGVFGDFTDVITGATYNGVAMALVGSVRAPGDRFVYLFRLVGPSTGANNVVVSASGSVVIAGQSVSYTGAAQSAQPDVNTTNTASATSPFNTSVTTTVDQDWAVLVTKNNKGAATPGTSTTQRESNANGLGMWDTNAAVSPAGSVTLSAVESSADWGGVMEAFKPAGGGGGRGLFQAPILNGLGGGGSGFFNNPLGAPMMSPVASFKRNRSSIYVPDRMAA